MRPAALPRTAITVLVVFVALAAGVPTATTPASGQERVSLAETTQVDPDSVLLRIDLRGDGSATWRVEYRLRLDDRNSTQAFASIQADIAANRSRFERRFAADMRRSVAEAENATGRRMVIRNVTIGTANTTLPQRYGVIVYTFVWDGFATVQGDTISGGDAIAGFFLDAETTLLVSWPAGYRLVDVTPTPDERRSRAVAWVGRLDFTDAEPRVVVSSSQATTTTTAGGEGTGVSDGPDGDGTGAVTVPVEVAGGVAIALVILAAGIWSYRHRGEFRPRDTEDGGDEHGPPAELLSNEERVLRLLEENDGRVKQQQVATELGWTDAKTSQVVGALRKDDRIKVFRLGRENVIALPDETDI